MVWVPVVVSLIVIVPGRGLILIFYLRPFFRWTVVVLLTECAGTGKRCEGDNRRHQNQYE